MSMASARGGYGKKTSTPSKGPPLRITLKKGGNTTATRRRPNRVGRVVDVLLPAGSTMKGAGFHHGGGRTGGGHHDSRSDDGRRNYGGQNERRLKKQRDNCDRSARACEERFSRVLREYKNHLLRHEKPSVPYIYAKELEVLGDGVWSTAPATTSVKVVVSNLSSESESDSGSNHSGGSHVKSISAHRNLKRKMSSHSNCNSRTLRSLVRAQESLVFSLERREERWLAREREQLARERELVARERELLARERDVAARESVSGNVFF